MASIPFLSLGPSLNIPNILGIICAFIASLGSATMIITNQKNDVLYLSRAQIPFEYNETNKYSKKHLSIISFKAKTFSFGPIVNT